MRFKRTFTDPAPQRTEDGFRKAGMDTFHGAVSFTGPSSIRVGADLLEAKHVLIATGAKPQRLNIPGEEHFTRSDQFLELDSLPRRVIFIGGGYISFEFAHLSARAGSRVTVLHRGERPLEAFDSDLVQRLLQKTRELGIHVELRAQATAIEGRANQLVVTASTPQGPRRFEADMVVHGSGRVADIDELNLGAAGIETSERAVKVNSFLQSSSNTAVYAAGDAADTALPKLTPVAGYEGGIVASNLLKGNHRKVEKITIPSVVFTVPPLATVGLSEEAARKEGRRFRVHTEDTGSWYSSRRVAEKCSGFKVLIEDNTDHILGAHLLGPEAGRTYQRLYASDAHECHVSDAAPHDFRVPYPRVGCGLHVVRTNGLF